MYRYTWAKFSVVQELLEPVKPMELRPLHHLLPKQIPSTKLPRKIHLQIGLRTSILSKGVSTYRNAPFFAINALGFSSSVTLVEVLTVGFPFQRELRTSYFSLMFVYSYGTFFLVKGVHASILFVCSFAMPSLLVLLPRLIEKAKQRSSSTDQD